MRYLLHLPLAYPTASPKPTEQLTMIFQELPPDPKGDDVVRELRMYYNEQAVRFLDALQAHAPGGFVDAVFGELAHRKASVFRVAG